MKSARHPCRQNVAQGVMLDQVKTDVETIGMDLSNICDLEDRLEAYTLLPNVANLVLLCGIAHITKGPHIVLRKAYLHGTCTVAAS
jgi:hypothetical protein